MSSLKKPFGLLFAAIVAINLIGVYFLVPPMKPIRAQLGSVQTWAGNATGTNSLTINVHNIANTSDLLGVPLRFLPAAINTTSVTVTINLDGGGTIGPVNVLKPSTGSLISFIGGEFQTGQVATITYDGTQFQCSTCSSAVSAGTVADYSGPVVPAGWLKTDGSAVSRSAQPALFAALVISGVTATTTNTNTSVIVASSSNYQVGWFVGGANVNCNSTITSIPDGTHIVLSSGATGSGATTLTIGPYAQGDCSTTFNIPNYIGKTTAMSDGTTNITSATCTNPATIGDKQTQSCGTQTQTLTLAQLPTGIASSGSASTSGSVSGSITVTSTVSNVAQGALNSIVNPGGGGSTLLNCPPCQSSAITSTGSNSMSGTLTGSSSVTSTNTSGTAHPILQPTSLTYKIIKT